MLENSFDVEYWARENYWALADLFGPYYMDRRIQSSGLVWGTEPSMGAEDTLKFFRERGVEQILDFGCGYGRDAVFFSRHGYHVTGVEHSKEACRAAEALYQFERSKAEKITKQSGKKTSFGSFTAVHADIRSWSSPSDLFDAAFSFKTFHQFRHDFEIIPGQKAKHHLSARNILDFLSRFVRPDGFVILSMFSTKDDYFGKGKYIEEDTFDIRGHRPCAFYSEVRLRDLFSSMNIHKLDLLEIPENHPPDGEHTHRMWLIIASKNGSGPLGFESMM
ncbi:MAG: class I SAM-dependent methyltransferase [Desulfobacterales bacterium]|uniref:Class I SAM-dependent methyltransferase n=2 Tax=Desulfobacterales TaxID=213118 RepID=A0A8J6NRP8_9BACT|nr:class I SAM-dependent methyltransferase [Candidatus Desulfatibia vada]